MAPFTGDLEWNSITIFQVQVTRTGTIYTLAPWEFYEIITNIKQPEELYSITFIYRRIPNGSISSFTGIDRDRASGLSSDCERILLHMHHLKHNIDKSGGVPGLPKSSLNADRFIWSGYTDIASQKTIGITVSGAVRCNQHPEQMHCPEIDEMLGNQETNTALLGYFIQDMATSSAESDDDNIQLQLQLPIKDTNIYALLLLERMNQDNDKIWTVSLGSQDPIGYFVPNEDGLDVLHDIFLDYIRDFIIGKVECQSRQHFRAAKETRLVSSLEDALSYYVNGMCVNCVNYRDKTALTMEEVEQLIPGDDDIKNWKPSPRTTNAGRQGGKTTKFQGSNPIAGVIDEASVSYPLSFPDVF